MLVREGSEARVNASLPLDRLLCRCLSSRAEAEFVEDQPFGVAEALKESGFHRERECRASTVLVDQ